MSIILSSAEQTLALLPLVFGMYISYKILRVTDLTVDGTYVLGAAMFAKYIEHGVVIAALSSIIAGGIVGMIVALMQRKNVVSDLLVGVIASFMLYSINIQVMGKPNISLIGKQIESFNPILINVAIFVLLTILLSSTFGLLLRAFGQNQQLLYILGKPVELYRACGLIISNMLAAISGVLAAQLNYFADINMGFGVALVGIGAVVIGTHILNTTNCMIGLFSCVVGTAIYFGCLNALLAAHIDPVNLKLLLGLVLFMTLRVRGAR